MTNQLKDGIKIASITSLFLIIVTAALDQTLQHVKNKNRAYSAQVEPYPYVLKNYRDAGLSEENVRQLLEETSPSQGWEFEEITGFREVPRSTEYVNISDIGFRKNAKNRPTDNNLLDTNSTNERIYFFGGSTTFGYGVADHQTIPAILEALSADRTVFNFGRGYYFSEQENLLLDRLLNNGAPKPDLAIFLDGLNEGCTVSTYKSQLKTLFARASSIDYNWYADEKLKPYIYAGSKIKSKLGLNSKASVGRDVKETSCKNLNLPPIPLRDVFLANLETRRSICRKHGISCITFLQPLPGSKSIHRHIEPHLSEAFKKKYTQLLSPESLNSEGFEDISDTLLPLQKHAYIDNVHYSPEANSLIARRIHALITPLLPSQ